MADWTHLSLTADARRNLEAELDASRGDWLKTMQGIDDYVDELVAGLFDPDDPEHSLAYTDPDAIADAARDIVSLAQEAADSRYMVQRAAWSQAAGADFPGFAGADREDWTRVMWDVRKGFSNTDYNGLTYGQVMAGKARSGVSIMDLLPKAGSSNPDDLQQAYADFLRQMAVHAAQRQQMANIAADPTRPRWARVPRGRVTCAFCTMLAGRGFVYTSEEAAGGGLGNVYHAHCDCEPVPTWGEAKLSGYDPGRLDALYREAARGLPAGASYRDVLARMREAGGVADSLVGSAIARDTHGVFRAQLGDASLKACLEGTNPRFDEGPEWQNNCQRCVVAYRMRRLGYAVQATACEVTANGQLSLWDWGVRHWREAFKGMREVPCAGRDEAEAVAKSWGDGGCGVVYVTWSKTGDGHVFIAENIKGVVHFMDPQTGNYNVERYFSRAAPGMTTIMRIDDKEPDIPVIRRLCEEAT
ncbi:toxin glutamine deamidase domain-containing protein [Pseudoscardovia radai]|uniref:VG15 protein n=1 Tax=Pseudoscardovia radai TaxID=987066 RepID=UPI003991975A